MPILENEATPEYILRNPRFFPYFENCLGALDGCHVSSYTNKVPYRNRKGNITTNVLGVVNFCLMFLYVLAGWEGSAHDGKVLDDAKLKGLPMPPQKYYLGDAGYCLSRLVLTPYRGVRYHLKEWNRANLRPRNSKELFNLRHSSLRNVIERSFGVMKKRFPLLQLMHSYELKFQSVLTLCAFYLHNLFVQRKFTRMCLI